MTKAKTLMNKVISSAIEKGEGLESGSVKVIESRFVGVTTGEQTIYEVKIDDSEHGEGVITAQVISNSEEAFFA